MSNSVSVWLTRHSKPLRLWLDVALIGGMLMAPPLSSALAGGYLPYATGLVKKLPEGVAIRPDLEAYLAGRANSYRVAHGRSGLAPDQLMSTAARAQAIDMMLAGRSGHTSRSGDSFNSRFGAFVENVDLYRARGENAASERRKGPVDRAKAERLFALWLDSSAHRRNLMSRDYTFVSTGVVQKGDELWAVQIFWSRPIPPNPLIQ